MLSLFLFKNLPVSLNLSYFWNLGSLLGFCLFFQIISGFFLVFYYSNYSFFSFFSVQYIMNEVGFGWFFRLLHFNLVSFFFILVFLHFLKAFFFFWVSFKGGLIFWYFYYLGSYVGFFFGLCYGLSPNVLLGWCGDYQFVKCYSLFWGKNNIFFLGFLYFWI